MEIGIIEAQEISEQYPAIAAQYPSTRKAGHNGETATLTHYFVEATDADGNPTKLFPFYVEDGAEEGITDEEYEDILAEDYEMEQGAREDSHDYFEDYIQEHCSHDYD